MIFTINSGADYQLADSLHLAGGVSSYRTALPEEINNFDKFKVGVILSCCIFFVIVWLFQEIFLTHLRLMVQGLYNKILGSYGNPWKICPSPLLSCLLEGCLESGKDLTNGGSRLINSITILLNKSDANWL